LFLRFKTSAGCFVFAVNLRCHQYALICQLFYAFAVKLPRQEVSCRFRAAFVIVIFKRFIGRSCLSKKRQAFYKKPLSVFASCRPLLKMAITGAYEAKTSSAKKRIF